MSSLQTLPAPAAAPSPRSHIELASPATTKYDVSARRIELWSPWGPAARPATARDETRFVAHLRSIAGTATSATTSGVTYERQHVTSLVTALRNGLTATQMVQMAPGLEPTALLAAHEDLDTRRQRSADAWAAIVASPDQATLAEHGPLAAALLPVIVIRLGALHLRRRTDAPLLRSTILAIDDEVRRTVHSTVMLEERLDRGSLSDAQEAQVGEMLYDAFGEGAWSLSTFLAPRVGTLVPARVAALLGEERRDRNRAAS
jgi:hypothetical protein